MIRFWIAKEFVSLIFSVAFVIVFVLIFVILSKFKK